MGRRGPRKIRNHARPTNGRIDMGTERYVHEPGAQADPRAVLTNAARIQELEARVQALEARIGRLPIPPDAERVTIQEHTATQDVSDPVPDMGSGNTPAERPDGRMSVEDVWRNNPVPKPKRDQMLEQMWKAGPPTPDDQEAPPTQHSAPEPETGLDEG